MAAMTSARVFVPLPSDVTHGDDHDDAGLAPVASRWAVVTNAESDRGP